MFLNPYIFVVFSLLLLQLLKEEFTLCLKQIWKETEKKAETDFISFFLPSSLNGTEKQ